VFDKLEEIKSALVNSSAQMNVLQGCVSDNHTNVLGILQNKIDSISSNLKDITNSEMKIMFGELQKSLSTGQDTQIMRNVLENFKDKIENLNLQKLNDFDRKTLDVLSSMQTNMIQSLDSHTISHKIAAIETNITNISEHFSSNSSKKGQLAEGVLLNLMNETFLDTEVNDTSHVPNSGDIQLVKENKPTILIDSKHFNSKTVPKRDLDKFYTDIQHHNCSGILCNAFGGIANKQHFEIDIIDKNILVFVHSHKFDASVFQIAVNIIYNMHEQIKDKKTDSINIDQRHYQNLKIEYNYYIQSFRHHLDIIKTNVNSLSQLSFTLLDNFFKRKANMVELKGFTCHLCGTGCKTDKILKTHLKNKHPNKPAPSNDIPLIVSFNDSKRGRPKKTVGTQEIDEVSSSPKKGRPKNIETQEIDEVTSSHSECSSSGS
jgi:hypothetical protein